MNNQTLTARNFTKLVITDLLWWPMTCSLLLTILGLLPESTLMYPTANTQRGPD